MSSKNLLILAAALCVIFFAGGRAAFAVAEWSGTASACVPDEGSTLSNYAISSNFVQFTGSATGDVIMVCSMASLIDGDTASEYWAMFEGDQDTTGTNYWALAELRKINVNTGTHTAIDSVISDQNSYERLSAGLTDFTIDNDNEAYYSFIWLKRTGTLDNPTMHGIQLF
jgi:hypothetical protein